MLDIRNVGLDRYARDAEVLMMAWAINDQSPRLWLPHEGPMPEQVRMLLCSPAAIKTAWNAAFERAILRHSLGIVSPIEQWVDPSVIARYAGMPGKLAKVSQFMKLGDKGKDKDGTRLINKFSKPFKGQFRDFKDLKHAADWQKFQDYCRQDVNAEREIFHRLKGFFMPPSSEARLWELDAKINERGMPVSMRFVVNAKVIADAEMARLAAELKELTGLANPNSVSQLLPWLKARGYPVASLDKAHVARALANDSLKDDGRLALVFRQQLSLTSVKKLNAIVSRVGPGDRIRNGYRFYGAHTGRWSAEGVQPHNFPRGTIDPEKVDRAVEALSNG